MITLTQKEVEDLKNFANEIPTKYGITILQFLIGKEKEEEEKNAGKKK
jgi:hypothetical protein